MAKKTFAGAPKPGRRPTAEEIESFEATGRKPESTETRKAVNAPSRAPALQQTRITVSTPSQLHAYTETKKSAKDEEAAPAPEPIVRLTIDLPEDIHTRFKAACAASRRKMVQEVRLMIEARTAELESRT